MFERQFSDNNRFAVSNSRGGGGNHSGIKSGAEEFENKDKKNHFDQIGRELQKQRGLTVINYSGGHGAFGFVMFVKETETQNAIVQSSNTYTSTDKQYAVKMQRIDFDEDDKQKSQLKLDECKAEAEVMATLSDIENVVKFHSQYEMQVGSHKYHIIQMELCQGTLNSWVNLNKAMISDNAFLSLAIQIMDGVDNIHKKGYVLTDHKNENILITRDQRAVISDFGLVRKLSNGVFKGEAQGSLFAHPPEVMNILEQNGNVVEFSPNTDVFSVGIGLYYMCGGAFQLYPRLTAKTMKQPPYVSEKISDLIKLFLVEEPSQRKSLSAIKTYIRNNFKSFNVDQKHYTDLTLVQEIQHIGYQRFVEFDFYNAVKLYEKYDGLYKDYQNDLDVIVTLGFLEIRYNCNLKRARQLFEAAQKLNPEDIDVVIGLTLCDITANERRNFKERIKQLLLFKNIIKQDNKQESRILYYLAYLYHLEENETESQKHIELALQKDVGDSLILSLQGMIRTDQPQYQRIKIFETAAENNKRNDPLVYFRMGVFYLEVVQNSQQAKNQFEKAMNICDKDLTFHLKKVETYLKIDAKQAEEQFVKLQEDQKFKNNAVLLTFKGKFFAKTRDEKKVIFHEAIKQNKQCMEPYELLARIFEEEDDYYKAIDNWEEIIKIDIDYWKAYYNLGGIYYKLKKFDEAFSKFKHADDIIADIKIEKYDSKFMKACALREKQDFDAAMFAFQEYIAKDSKAMRGYNELAKLLIRSNHISQAIDLMRKSIELVNSEDYSFYEEYLRELIQSGKKTENGFEAKEEIRTALSSLITLKRLSAIYARIAMDVVDKEISKEDTLENIKKAEQLKPDSAIVHYFKGMYYERKEYNISLAVDSHKQAIQIDKTFANAYYELGTIYFELEKFLDAKNYLEQALEHNVNQSNIYEFLGVSCLLLKTEDEKATYYFSLNKNPQNSSVSFLHAIALKKQNKTEKAIGILEDLVLREPKFNNFFTLGEWYQEQNQAQKAVNNYRKATECESNEKYKAWIELGNVCKANREYDQAYSYYLSATKDNPKEVKPYMECAFIDYKYRNNAKFAILTYQRCLEVSPNNLDTLRAFGECYQHVGYYDYARKTYEQIVHTSPSKPLGYIMLGLLEQHMKLYERAIQCFRKAIEVDPDDHIGYFHIGIALREQFDMYNSQYYFKKAIELKPTFVQGIVELGTTQFENSKKTLQYQEPIETLKKAAEIDPKSEAYHEMGKVYHFFQKHPEAINCYEQYLKFHPQCTFAIEINRTIASLKDLVSHNDNVKNYYETQKLYNNLNPAIPNQQQHLGQSVPQNHLYSSNAPNNPHFQGATPQNLHYQSQGQLNPHYSQTPNQNPHSQSTPQLNQQPRSQSQIQTANSIGNSTPSSKKRSQKDSCACTIF